MYAFVNEIDLSHSFDYAESAYKKDQNQYTKELMALYLSSFGLDNEAAEFLNTVAIK